MLKRVLWVQAVLWAALVTSCAPAPVATSPTAPMVTATPTLAPTSTPAPSATPTITPSPTPARPPATRPPSRITAPAIGLDAPVLEIGYKTGYLDGVAVTEWELPSDAAGFHRGSAYPGNPGNTVLSGHNNIQGEVFRDLVNLEAGDEVNLYVGEVCYRYRVSTIEILPEKGMPTGVRIANARRIGPTADERLTLVTCWPYTGNSHRVIVVAMPVTLEGRNTPESTAPG